MLRAIVSYPVELENLDVELITAETGFAAILVIADLAVHSGDASNQAFIAGIMSRVGGFAAPGCFNHL